MEEHPENCPCSAYKLSATSDNIFGLIDYPSIKLYNEKKPNAGKSIIRPEENKWEFDPSLTILESYKNEPEIFIYIKFKEEVKLRALNIISVENGLPDLISIYINEENVSWDLISEPPYEVFMQPHFTPKFETEIYPKINKEKPIRNIGIYMKGKYGFVGLQYLGIKGFGNKSKRGIVEADYELIATNDKQMSENLLKDINFAGGF